MRCLQHSLALASLLICAGLCAAATTDAPKESPKPAKAIATPTMPVHVTQWIVMVADITNPRLNGKGLFDDELPPFCESLRSAPPADRAGSAEAAPIGVIRFSADGPVDHQAKIDVQLSFKEGRVLAHWPRGNVRSSGLLWQDVQLAAGKPAYRSLPSGSWLAPLRDSGLLVQLGATQEAFLLHDIELNALLALQVKSAGDGKYSVAHGMDAALLDATLYKPDGAQRWRSATIAKLDRAKDFPKPTVEKAAEPSQSAQTQVIYAGGMVMSSNSKKTAPAEPASSVVLPTSAIDVKGTEVALGAPQSAEEALAPWRDKLKEAGAPDVDQQTLQKILDAQALDPKRLTLVYRVDPAELERILPLEIVPQPTKISRIALVVVRGVDPAVGDELDRLIKQLGDPAWKTRDEATREIKKLGIVAKPKLEKAAQNSDVEVAYRAELLLQRLKRPTLSSRPTPDDDQ